MLEQIKFVDLEWLDANFPCMGACPVHTEAGRYVGLIEEGQQGSLSCRSPPESVCIHLRPHLRCAL